MILGIQRSVSIDQAGLRDVTAPFFSHAWEQRKLGSVIEERNIQQAQSRKYPLVSFTVEQGVTPKTKRYEREQLVVGDKASKKYKITEYNDIVYNPANLKFGAISRNTYGNAVFSPIYVTFVVDLEVASPSFIGLFVTRQDFIQRSLMYQQGTVYERQSVNPEDLLSMNCYLPSRPEQESISLLFGQLDDLITLHQRKLSHLRELKRGLLQKMFPKSGEDRPEVRFPGFADAWEQRKLSEVVNVRSGMDYKHLSEGDIPVYGTGGYMLSVDKALSYSEDAIGIGRKGTIDKPYLLRAPFWTVDTLFYAVPRDKSDLDFIHAVFQRIDWKQKDESTGVPSLSKRTINAVNVITPDEAEQHQIGAFFASLDDLIALHQRKQLNI